MKVKRRLPRRKGALLSKAWRGEYCLSANSTSNLILQRFLQRGRQWYVRRIWRVYTSIRFFFYHGYILRDLSHQLLVTGSQLFIFQEHYHLLPFIYLPYIMVGTGSSVFSSLPNPSVICCPAPGVTSQNDGLCVGGRGITWGFFPPHQGMSKRAPKLIFHSA